MSNQNNSDGFIALMSIIIVLVIVTAIVVSVLLLGTSSAQTSLTHQQSLQARALASACAEEAILRLIEDDSYTGPDSVTLGEGACEIVAVSGSGSSNRQVQAQGQVLDVVQRIQVDVDQISPILQINRWQEVPSF